jgi:hypothetical protein
MRHKLPTLSSAATMNGPVNRTSRGGIKDHLNQGGSYGFSPPGAGQESKSIYKMVNSVKRLNDMKEFMRGKVEPWNCRAGQNSIIYSGGWRPGAVFPDVFADARLGGD